MARVPGEELDGRVQAVSTIAMIGAPVSARTRVLPSPNLDERLALPQTVQCLPWATSSSCSQQRPKSSAQPYYSTRKKPDHQTE